MTTSNTHIRIRRSTANAAPDLLQAGELAYSYLSNTAFIGTSDGLGVLKIGGEAYTAIIDAATSANTGNTLVLRDNDGSFSANVVTAEYFVGDGSQLTGLVTNLTFTGDAGGPNTINLLSDTLTLAGGDGISSNVDGNTITFDVDDTVFRSNTEGATQHVSTDVEISGNLTVQGTTTYVQTAINQTDDSMIELAANNTVGDVLDIGFYGKHEGVDGTVVTGLVRNAGTSDYYLFDNIAIGDQANLTSNIITQEALSANGASLYTYKFLATQSEGGTEGGYSFSGTEGGLDTGMFSPADGHLQFWSNAEKAGEINPSNDGTSLGVGSAATGQGYRAIALGYEAGQTSQSNFAVALGLHAGQNSQGTAAVAVGHSAGQDTQGQDATAIGSHSGQNNQGYRATAVGYRAGYGNDTAQGQYAVAVGTFAGYDSQVEYSIAINASGNNLNPTEAGLYIDPIRANNAVGGNVTTYNTSTKEVVYTDVTINDSGITLANGTVISDGESGLFVDALNYDGSPGNVAFYNVTTKEITYGSLGDLNPDSLANGSYTWSVDGTTGALYSDQGTYIADSANSVVIGTNVDVTNSNYGRVAIGESAGSDNQNYGSVAIGENAGQTSQNFQSVAVGAYAGNSNQNYFATAVGYNAGNTSQGSNSVAVGHAAGQNTQAGSSVAVGFAAGNNNQGFQAVAVGRRAGRNNQQDYAVAVGTYAGEQYQDNYAVAVGYNAGYYYQGSGSVAIGENAGEENLSADAIAIGSHAQQNGNGWAPIAIGRYAGQNTQSSQAIALGNYAGNDTQGYHSVAIGHYAGHHAQGEKAIAIGDYAGQDTQGYGSIAIGSAYAGYDSGDYSVALGYQAGAYDDTSGLGQYQVAIGYRAAFSYGHDNSIVLNASGSELNASEAGLYINPIRYTETQDETYDGIMFYNSDTKEVRYSYILDGGSF
jgi:hypothetical protein